MKNQEYLGDDVSIAQSNDGKHIIIWNKIGGREDGSVYLPKDIIGTIKDYIQRMEDAPNPKKV